MKFVSIVSLISAANAAAATTTWSGGPTYDIHYSAKQLKFTVMVPKDMWFALAYGTGMSGVDAVAFSGTQSGGNDGKVTDYWLQGNQPPTADSTNDYSPQAAVSFASDEYNFVTMRALDTKDDKDFKVECGNTYNFKWVGNSSTATVSSKHNKEGTWKFVINADCSIGSGASGAKALAAGFSAAALLAVQYL